MAKDNEWVTPTASTKKTTFTYNPSKAQQAEAMKSAKEKAAELKASEVAAVKSNSKSSTKDDEWSTPTATGKEAEKRKKEIESEKKTVQRADGTEIPIRSSSNTDNTEKENATPTDQNKVEDINVEVEDANSTSESEISTDDDNVDNNTSNTTDNNANDTIVENAANEVVADDTTKNEELKSEVKKQVAPKVGRLKQALINKEITQEEYNHFVADRVLTAIGKALGFLVSRDPSWLFYKDQWQERNANLLKQKQRVENLKTTANLTDEERKAAQESGELEVLTGDKAFAAQDPELYKKLQIASKTNELAKDLSTQISDLYAKNTEIDAQIKQLQTGVTDQKQMLEILEKARSVYGGLDTTSTSDSTSDSTNDTTSDSTNKSTSTNKTDANGSVNEGGGGGSAGVNVGFVKIEGNGAGKHTGTKNHEEGSSTNDLNTKSNSKGTNKSTSKATNKQLDAAFGQIQSLRNGMQMNSKQWNELNNNLIKGLREQKRFNTNRIHELERQANSLVVDKEAA